jgi:hypothetical protein
MKKNLLIITALLSISLSGNAQFFKLGDSPEKKISLRGPVEPVSSVYNQYTSYSVKLNISPGFENSLKDKKLAYSLNTLAEPLSIFGLKKADNGDFKIIYDLKRYEWVNNEDYIETTYQNAPAYYIGLESKLTILNKEGKEVYVRHTTPLVKMYVTDPGYSYETLAYRIVRNDFYKLLNDFDTFYLNSPSLDLNYFEVKKKKKSKSTFNVEEFNQSAQVFDAVLSVERANWGGLFGEAQKYWKTLVEFTDDDEDLQKDVRFAANYNLSVAALLLDKSSDFETHLPLVKENEKGFMGVRLNYDGLKRNQKMIAEAKEDVKEVAKIEPIAAEPDVYEYRKSPNAFRFAEIEEGEAVNQDNESIKGKIRIMSDFPEVVDWRTVQTKSGLGQLMGQMGSDKSTVRIFVEGEKKPKKANLKKLVYIKDKTGRTFITGKTGGAGNILAKDNMVNTKRYALFDEVKSTKKLALFREYFPQDSYVLKRPTEEEFFSPPGLVGRKKALREYFADCPAMLEKINKGEYDFNNKETYVKMYDDYVAANCGK